MSAHNEVIPEIVVNSFYGQVNKSILLQSMKANNKVAHLKIGLFPRLDLYHVVSLTTKFSGFIQSTESITQAESAEHTKHIHTHTI